MEAKSFLEQTEEQLIALVREGVDESGLKAKVDFYAGDANSPDSLEKLIADAAHLPRVLIGFRDKQNLQGSTSARFRQEDLTIDIYVCTASHRSKEHTVRKAYPLIEIIEDTLIGYTGLKWIGLDAHEREAVSNGSVQRIVDLPGFSIFQIPFGVHVNRQLQ